MAQQLSVDSNLNFGTDDSKARFQRVWFPSDRFQHSVRLLRRSFQSAAHWSPQHGECASRHCGLCGCRCERGRLCHGIAKLSGHLPTRSAGWHCQWVLRHRRFCPQPCRGGMCHPCLPEYWQAVWAWFQPHGFGPMKFMHKELEEEVLKASTLRTIFTVGCVLCRRNG